MNKHTATCPNGQIVKRNSANRTYSHVTVIFNIKKNAWVALGWSSTLDLAKRNCQKEKTYLDKLIKMNYYTGVYGDKPECLVLEASIS